MVDFVQKMIKNLSSKEEQIALLVEEYNKLKDELFDLENFIPEEGLDFDKEMERIDAKIHSVKLKMRYLKDALIEMDALDYIEKKDNTPKVQFTIHNEEIKKRVDSMDDEEEEEEEEEYEDDEIEVRDNSDIEERYFLDDDNEEEDEDSLNEDLEEELNQEETIENKDISKIEILEKDSFVEEDVKEIIEEEVSEEKVDEISKEEVQQEEEKLNYENLYEEIKDESKEIVEENISLDAEVSDKIALIENLIEEEIAEIDELVSLDTNEHIDLEIKVEEKEDEE